MTPAGLPADPTSDGGHTSGELGQALDPDTTYLGSEDTDDETL